MSSNFKNNLSTFSILLKPSNISLFVLAQTQVIFPILVKFYHSLKYSSLGTTLEKDLVKLFETLK